MTTNIQPSDDNENDCNLARECAILYIKIEIFKSYGLRSEILDFFYDLWRTEISDDLFSRALQVQRRAFNDENIHEKCRKTLRSREREASRLADQIARLPAGHSRAWKRSKDDYVISHHRYQLPVGQGGFHVGTLKTLGADEAAWRSSLTSDAIPSADFLYVYDCGSDPKAGVVGAVRSIVKRRPSRKLDMLFVSHFDRDHICGIPHLLDRRNGLRVDTIVMPYLDEVDRVIGFARTADTASDGATEQFHQDLVVDPTATMSRFSPRQIVTVMPSNEDGDADYFELPPTDPPRSPTGRDYWKAIDSTASYNRRAPDGSTVTQRLDLDILAGTDFGGWRMSTYVKRAALSDREAFCAAVEVLLRWPRGSFREKVRSKRHRRLMVTDHRTAVSRAYAWAFGDKNETSLSLFSGPAAPDQAGAVYWNMPYYPSARIGWIGTGDAGLRDRSAVTDFQNFYQDDLDWVSTFVLPHHGSAHNYDHSNPVLDAEIWVAAAQPTRSTWKHPAPEIVKAVKASGAKFKKVGSQPKSLFEERMVVFWPSESST